MERHSSPNRTWRNIVVTVSVLSRVILSLLTKKNPARREFVFLEIIIVSSFLMKFIKLKIRKAPKGCQNPSGAKTLAPSGYSFSYVTPEG
jgi:hypothetical protein